MIGESEEPSDVRETQTAQCAVQGEGGAGGPEGGKTTSELASEHQIHPAQISQWKKVAMEGLSTLFERPGSKPSVTVEEATAPLFEEIGRLKMELDWLQKKGFSRSRSDG